MTPGSDINAARTRENFERAWDPPRGWGGWFASVENQPFGNRFMAASFVFFILAGILALLMRIQLAAPENDFLGPEVYNQLYTMHGATMMYLVLLPFLEGLAIYLLPLFIGAREMAFPRMSAFSFWVFFSGGLVFFSGFLFNALPDAGWFVYPPISSSRYAGIGMDFLLVGLGFIEIAGVGAGIEIAVTILKFRAPGMSLGKMPLFAWAWLVTSFMIVLAFSTLFGATVLIELDRAVGTAFFDPERGGHVLLWQHLFWFFGHPDVYIMFLPATGMISMIIPTFARRTIAGYKYIAVAIMVTGFMSFGLWVHHMFTTGLPPLAMGFFVAASLIIAIATSVQIFAWIATLWRRRPGFSSPMLFVLGFLFVFVLGGLTGVMVAVLPFDLQAHDTYFVVAHFHYVLVGGVIFPILAAVHYWMPLLIGRMPNERIARWSFWLIFLGFNVTFFPMHITGLMGLPRRVYTYTEDLGISGMNMLSSVAAFVLGAGFLLVAYNVYWSLKRAPKAPKNPWGAGSLEWSQTIDMPNYVFSRPPVVYDTDPLWNFPSDSERNPELERMAKNLEAQPEGFRAAIVTDAVSGEPQAVQRVAASPTYIPIIAALGLLATSIATLVQAYLAAAAGTAFTLVVVAYWLWPKDRELREIQKCEVEETTGLTVAPTGSKASGWWAMWGVLTVAGTVFGVLFYSYFYLRLYSSAWPQDGLPLPARLSPALIYALPLGAGALLMYLRSKLGKIERKHAFAIVAIALAIVSVFLVGAMRISAEAPFTATVNAYGSVFHVTLWHLALLGFGALGLLVALIVRIFNRTCELNHGYVVLQTQVTVLYLLFTAFVSALCYGILHVTPHF